MVVSHGSEGFCQTSPYPTEEQLAAYYESEYREVRNEVPDQEYIRFMDHRAEIQMGYILETSGRSGFESALDIGCGAGRLLNKLGTRCGRVQGYEADKAMAGFALANRTGPHIDVINELFQPENSGIRTQLITMSHVLEHVPEPGTFLRRLHTHVLGSGGHLFVEVPNDPDHWVEKQIKWGIRGLAHINYFTETSLERCLTNSGYEIVSLRTCGLPLDRFIRQRKPKSLVARQLRKLSALLPARPQADAYRTSLSSRENIYLQAVAVAR
ncbi:hypothetical protein GCM10023212_35090 [Luteolibacter yonseiensis]